LQYFNNSDLKLAFRRAIAMVVGLLVCVDMVIIAARIVLVVAVAGTVN